MKRKAITARELEAAYNRCLQLERDRERKWKLTKQGAFESSILHFDMQAEEAHERQNSVSWLTDRGRGARAIRRAADPQPDPVATRQKCIDRARQLVSRKAKDCLTVFRLILKNGNNRKESIWQLMKKTPLRKPARGKRQNRSTWTS